MNMLAMMVNLDGSFFFKQGFFLFCPPSVTAYLAVRTDNPVAGHASCDSWGLIQSIAHGPECLGVASTAGDLFIRESGATGNAFYRAKNFFGE